MTDDNSLRDTLNQLVALQAQQLNAVNTLVQQNNQGKGMPSTSNAQSSSSQAIPNVQYTPNYMPPSAPFSSASQAARNQYAGYAERLNSGMSFYDTVFANRTKISPQNKQVMASESAANISNAMMSGGGVVATGVADIGASMLAPGFFGSIAAGAIGGAAVGGLFNIGLDQNKQTQAYNKYLLQNSYRFINSAESTNKRDIDGFGFGERYQAAGFLRHFNTGMKISDNDTMTLLQKYTEGGLLKDVKDLETFRNKMTQLTKTVKTSALLLNETFENVSQLMSDMNKSGITAKNFDYLSAKARVGGGYTGQSATEFMGVTNNITQNITQGTGYSNLNTNLRTSDTLIYMNSLYENAKKNQSNAVQGQLYNVISNTGGAEGATSLVMQAQNQFVNSNYGKLMGAYFGNYDAATGTFSIDQKALNEFINSDKSMTELSSLAQQRINSWGSTNEERVQAAADWESFYGTSLTNGLSPDQLMKFMNKGINVKGTATGLKNTASIFSTLEGFTPEQATILGAYFDLYKQDQGALGRQAAAQAMQTQMVQGINSMNAGWGYGLKNGWESFKDTVGDVFTPFTKGIDSAQQWLTDKWYGTQYTDGSLSKGRDWSSEQLKTEGQDVVKSLLEGVKQGLREAENSGLTIKESTKEYFTKLSGTLASDSTPTYASKAGVGSELFKNVNSLSWQEALDVSNTKDRLGFSQKLAAVFDMTYEDTAVGQGKLNIAIRKQYGEYLDELRDYKKNGNTSVWATKYNTAERMQILKRMQVMSGYMGEGLGMDTIGDATQYYVGDDQRLMNEYIDSRGINRLETNLGARATTRRDITMDEFLKQAVKDASNLYIGDTELGLTSNMSVDEVIKQLDKVKEDVNTQAKKRMSSKEHLNLMQEIEGSNLSADDKTAALNAIETGDYQGWANRVVDKGLFSDLTARVTREAQMINPEILGKADDANSALRVVQSRGQDFAGLGLTALYRLVDTTNIKEDFEKEFGKGAFAKLDTIGEIYGKEQQGAKYMQDIIERDIFAQTTKGKDAQLAFIENFRTVLQNEKGITGTENYVNEIKDFYGSGDPLDTTLFRELVEKLLTKLDAGTITGDSSSQASSGEDVTGLLVDNNNYIAQGIEVIRKMADTNRSNLARLENSFNGKWVGFFVNSSGGGKTTPRE